MLKYEYGDKAENNSYGEAKMIKYSINQGYFKAVTGREIPYSDSIKLAAAKNGGDSATVTLLSDNNEGGIKLSVGECPAGVTCSAFLVHTLMANGEKWPDPLTELDGEIDLTANEYQSIYIRFDWCNFQHSFISASIGNCYRNIIIS